MHPRRPRLVRGLLHPGSGPVVRILLHGQAGVAVLDTGASISVIDRDLARSLRLNSPGAVEWSGVNAHGNRSVAALRTAEVQLIGDGGTFSLDMVEVPRIRQTVPGLDVLALLGWDFLESCTLICDGPAGTFELRLPRSIRGGRRLR